MRVCVLLENLMWIKSLRCAESTFANFASRVCHAKERSPIVTLLVGAIPLMIITVNVLEFFRIAQSQFDHLGIDCVIAMKSVAQCTFKA